MHRLFFSVATVFVSGLLISISVLAQPAAAGDAEITLKLAGSQPATVLWTPGVQSTNVNILTPVRRAGTSERGPVPIGLKQLKIRKRTDRASALLKRVHRTGRRLPEVVLTGVDNGGRPVKMRLYAVKVTSYSVNGSGLDDGSIPTETLSLNFDKATASF